MSRIIRCKIAGWPMYGEDDIHRWAEWAQSRPDRDIGIWCTIWRERASSACSGHSNTKKGRASQQEIKQSCPAPLGYWASVVPYEKSRVQALGYRLVKQRWYPCAPFTTWQYRRHLQTHSTLVHRS